MTLVVFCEGLDLQVIGGLTLRAVELRDLGPVGGVIRAMMERAPDDKAEHVQHAAEELEVYCHLAVGGGL